MAPCLKCSVKSRHTRSCSTEWWKISAAYGTMMEISRWQMVSRRKRNTVATQYTNNFYINKFQAFFPKSFPYAHSHIFVRTKRVWILWVTTVHWWTAIRPSLFEPQYGQARKFWKSVYTAIRPSSKIRKFYLHSIIISSSLKFWIFDLHCLIATLKNLEFRFAPQ